jgi:hypothetical protein
MKHMYPEPNSICRPKMVKKLGQVPGDANYRRPDPSAPVAASARG